MLTSRVVACAQSTTQRHIDTTCCSANALLVVASIAEMTDEQRRLDDKKAGEQPQALGEQRHFNGFNDLKIEEQSQALVQSRHLRVGPYS